MAKSSKSRPSKKTTVTKKETPAKAKAAKPAAKAAVAVAEVPVERRERSERRGGDRRQASVPVAVERRQLERREKVSRRRQIDPTTCERDYTLEEIEFMAALDKYKRTSGRMFPTCSEILEVFKGLGYQKVHALESASAPLELPSLPASPMMEA